MGTYDAFLLLDLDHFKDINIAFGRSFGDELLMDVGRCLCAVTQCCDTVAYLGSDEFAVLRHCGRSAGDANFQAQQLATAIVQMFGLLHVKNGHVRPVTGSIGAIVLGPGTASVSELLNNADMAMYDAKAAGRNAYRSFNPAGRALAEYNAALDRELSQALLGQQFRLFYQPVFDHTRKMSGVEALVRWMHPYRGLVEPGEFISQAEKSDLIVDIGGWVLRTACKQIAEWQQDLLTSGLTVAVNISARHIQRPDFVAQVLSILTETGVNPSRLKFELTESMLLENVYEIIDKMALLKGHGIGFALDDFGTGYSSLSYLECLPITHIKIDRSFVKNMFLTVHSATIVKALISLALDLGLDVVAEGVELEEQFLTLKTFGCKRFQGFLFSAAVEARDLRRWIV